MNIQSLSEEDFQSLEKAKMTYNRALTDCHDVTKAFHQNLVSDSDRKFALDRERQAFNNLKDLRENLGLNIKIVED